MIERPGGAGRAGLRRGGGRRGPSPSWPAWWPPPVPGARRAAVVTQAGIGVAVDPGLPADEFTVPDGEGAKSLAVVEELCRGFARAGLGRSDVVVAVGGGVVTDLAGFAAAVLPPGDGLRERGHHPAGPGGRGHRRQDRGQPPRGEEPGRGVLAAERRSSATPRCWPPCRPREWASGRGEMAKYAFLGGSATGGRPDASLLDLALGEQVARCVAIKADGGGGRRAGGRPPDGPQLRAHPGPRPGGRRLRSRRRPATSATARRWPSAWSSPPCWPGGWGASTTTGSSCTAGWSARFDLSAALPAGADAERWCRSWPGTRRPATTSPSCSTGPGGSSRSTASTQADVLATLAEMEGPEPGDASVSTAGSILLLSGPNLNLLGEREPAVYGSATLDDHVATATGAAAGLGLTLEHLQTNHEGDLVEAVHAGPGPGRRHHRQRRRPHPHVVVAARRPGRLRRGRGRAPPVATRRPASRSATPR